MTATTRPRHGMAREFLLFVVTLYGMGSACAVATMLWVATIYRPGLPAMRLSIGASLLLMLVLSWASGYAFARWVRS